MLPLGISFFTFTQIAFLVEVYRGEATDLSFDRYALFVTFFPHLIAGPILYYREIGPQLWALYRRPFFENISIGLTVAMIGLFKKVVLADNVAPFVSPVFEAAEAGRHLADRKLGRRSCVCATTLFRFFRLLGHGYWTRPDVRRGVSR